MSNNPKHATQKNKKSNIILSTLRTFKCSRCAHEQRTRIKDIDDVICSVCLKRDMVELQDYKERPQPLKVLTK